MILTEDMVLSDNWGRSWLGANTLYISIKSEEKIMEYLDIEDELFIFCVEFALENNLIIRQDGRFKITFCGKEFISVF